MLGLKYDSHLGALVKQVRDWDRATISVSARLAVDVDLDAVTLSLFGHILAASSTHPNMVPDERMRASLLAGRVLPDAPNIFYWIARDALPTILRGIALVRTSAPKEPTFLSALKCPPIAFAASEGTEFYDLPTLRTSQLTGKIRFWPALARRASFPERPAVDEVVMTGQTVEDARIAHPVFGD